MIVAFISVVVIGETLSWEAGLSVALIALGIMSVTLSRGKDGFHEPKAMLFAAGAGLLHPKLSGTAV